MTGNDPTSLLTVIALNSSLHCGIVTKRVFTNTKKYLNIVTVNKELSLQDTDFYCTEKITFDSYM